MSRDDTDCIYWRVAGENAVMERVAFLVLVMVKVMVKVMVMFMVKVLDMVKVMVME